MKDKKMSLFLFITYLLLLTWVIVYKMDLSVLYGRYESGSLNLIPLAGTAVYNGVLNYPEILFNVISFIPFGMYMEMLFRKASWFTNLGIILLVSLVFEVWQFVFIGNC